MEHGLDNTNSAGGPALDETAGTVDSDCLGCGRSDRRGDLPDSGRAWRRRWDRRSGCWPSGSRWAPARSAARSASAGWLPVTRGRRDLCLPEGGLRASGGLPLRLALAAGHRPGHHRHAGRRAVGLRRISCSPVRLGSESGGRRGHHRLGRGQHGGSFAWFGDPARTGCAEAGSAGFHRGLGFLDGSRRLVEPLAVLDAAARLRPTLDCAWPAP